MLEAKKHGVGGRSYIQTRIREFVSDCVRFDGRTAGLFASLQATLNVVDCAG
jgi:hypothetical protein